MMWPYIIFSLISVFILPLIEWVRYKIEYGKKPNLDKYLTVTIVVIVWIIQVWIMNLFTWRIIFFAFSCFGIRGTFYDPSLNKFLGRGITDESKTTNSKTDQFEQKKKISFLWQRVLYAGVAIVFGVLYELSKIIFK